MKLQSIQIKNYRSIEEIIFDINQLHDKTFTYGLIGINEVGKSTILKALALKDGLKNEKGEPLPLKKDFRDQTRPIEIGYLYILDKTDVQEFKEHLTTYAPSVNVGNIDFSNIRLIVHFDISLPSHVQYTFKIENAPKENEDVVVIQDQFKKIIFDKSHKSIFWTAEDRYLISQPINLMQFASSPDTVSISLKNCFLLAGMKNNEEIKKKIDLISESTEREQLENDLGEKVTEHINSAWPKHPIKITFNISDGLINFHVHDLNTKGKAKTADQRSDGFGQFISFLLTVSAQNKNNELSNSILLLDEPETHLHPQAQEDLLRELIKITQNNNNNIAFFATHSNYMIDKNDLSRNYKISKPKDATEKKQFDAKISTYASVTYEVFEIASMDYHNELYDKLREKYSNEINKDDVGILEFDSGFFQQKKKQSANYQYKGQKNQVTLSTYVRNAIHYPQNKDEKFFKHLQNSIKLLKSYEI